MDESPTLCTLTLPASLDIAGADPFRLTLLETLAMLTPERNQLAIDATQVERIGTACIQLLLAAARLAESRGARCIIQSPSPPLANAFCDLGLEEELKQRSA